jgi:hypothetical protein
MSEFAERLHRLLDRRLAEVCVCDVAWYQKAPASLCLDGMFGLRGVLMLIQIHDRDVGALPCIQHSDGTADPGIAPGDQSHHVLELL